MNRWFHNKFNLQPSFKDAFSEKHTGAMCIWDPTLDQRLEVLGRDSGGRPVRTPTRVVSRVSRPMYTRNRVGSRSTRPVRALTRGGSHVAGLRGS